uniref:Uncharacterized protein n=1 Tax=Panagrolaimus sp. JU765 TaxID=591449 RepID=A0AC34Q7B1_9BILA
MDKSTDHDFSCVPPHLRRRFIELLPSVTRFEFGFTNKSNLQQCLFVKDDFEMVDNIKIVIQKRYQVQHAFDLETGFGSHNFALTKDLSIICNDFDWFTRKVKLAKEMNVFMMITASYLEKFHIENLKVSKVFLLKFLKKCENLKHLIVKNCIIDETIDVGTELLPVIPKCKSLCLEETPEFTTNKNIALVLQKHAITFDYFHELTIDPYLPLKGLYCIEPLKYICYTPINLGKFDCPPFFSDTADSGDRINIQETESLQISFISFFPIMHLHKLFYPSVSKYFDNDGYFLWFLVWVLVMKAHNYLMVSTFSRPTIFNYFYRQAKFRDEFSKNFPYAKHLIYFLSFAIYVGFFDSHSDSLTNPNSIFDFLYHFVVINFILFVYDILTFLYQKIFWKH